MSVFNLYCFQEDGKKIFLDEVSNENEATGKEEKKKDFSSRNEKFKAMEIAFYGEIPNF